MCTVVAAVSVDSLTSFATVNCHNWSNTHMHSAYICSLYAFVLLVVNRDFFCGDLTVSYTLLLFTSRYKIYIEFFMCIVCFAHIFHSVCYSVIFLNCRQIWIPDKLQSNADFKTTTVKAATAMDLGHGQYHVFSIAFDFSFVHLWCLGAFMTVDVDVCVWDVVRGFYCQENRYHKMPLYIFFRSHLFFSSCFVIVRQKSEWYVLMHLHQNNLNMYMKRVQTHWTKL